MADKVENTRSLRYRGRIEQVGICFVRLIRLFVYQNDWKLLPMAVIIAGLVSLVVRNDFFVTMEGTLKGALALSCVAIWNGCFNSVQVICRERDIIKREHRSGMHISSYIVSHMLYQAILCLVQSGLTVYICIIMGIKIPAQGLLTPWMVVDIGITVFLISYSADMIALWISCLVHNTTTAMSIMPFLLITQLVFSGGIFTLPAWSDGISGLMISNYGVKCIAAQADYNNLPMATAWNTIMKLKDQDITVQASVEQIVIMLDSDENEMVVAIRTKRIADASQELLEIFAPEEAQQFKEFLKMIGAAPDNTTFGDAIDAFRESKAYENAKGKTFTFHVTIWKLIELIGVEKVQDFLQVNAAVTQQKPYYEMSQQNIANYWIHFLFFILAFGALSIVTLEFIDKDKR